MKGKLYLFIVLIFSVVLSFSQSLNLYGQGTLRGKVIDAETGEALIGATIVVTGTTRGAITDFDGNYTLTGLDPGITSITVQYVSYEPQTFPDVEIKDGDVAVLDVNLGQQLQDIEEVQVVARQRQRTEAALQVMQRKSATVIDGISSRQISRLGDSDAAGALKRVTGISVEGGKYVYVRGLSDRYSKTTLNGAEVPGLDPNKNAVQMDLFPANLIENMIVHKTFAPDLPGDFTGGVVDIITRDFPSRFTLQFSASLGYNPQVHFNKDVITYQGGKTDWLGMDDGTREFDVKANTIVPAPWYGAETDQLLGDIGRSFNRILDFEKKSPFLNQSYSFGLGNQVELGNKGRALGFNLSLSYSKDHDYYTDGRKYYYEILGDQSEILNPKKLTSDELADERVIWSAMANTSLKLSSNHKLGFRAMHNQSGQSSSRYNKGSEPDENRFIEERTLGYLERSLSSFQVNGKHVFPGAGNLAMEWFSSYTLSNQNEPDFRMFFNDYEPLQIRSNKEPRRDSRKMQETNWDTKAHFTLPFQVFSRSAKLKFGAAYTSKYRTSKVNSFNLVRQGNVPYNGNPYEYVAPENFIDSVNNWNVIYYFNTALGNAVNSYRAEQYVVGSYIMVDVPLFEKLRMVTGVRYEISGQFVENFVDSTEGSNSKWYDSGEGEYRDWLPSFNLTYSLVENMNLRLAYNRTIARPVFRELAPYASWDYKGGYRVVGNPNLKRTTIDNIDFRWEYFFAPGEIISFSAFYKYFRDPIEQRDAPTTNNPEINYENIADSRLFGLEMEFRKQLDFIPALRDFQIGTNLTYIWSEMEEDSLFLEAARKTDPNYPAKREMYGQSPYIINAFMGYHNPDAGIRSDLVFNLSGPKIFLITKGGLPNVYEQPFPLLDFNFSKSLGERWNLRFSVRNLLNPEFKQTYTYKGQEYYFGGNTPGREFKLGISYLIN
jgi:outer membrane receptor protein involved in Fe transport